MRESPVVDKEAQQRKHIKQSLKAGATVLAVGLGFFSMIGVVIFGIVTIATNFGTIPAIGAFIFSIVLGASAFVTVDYYISNHP